MISNGVGEGNLSVGFMSRWGTKSSPHRDAQKFGPEVLPSNTSPLESVMVQFRDQSDSGKKLTAEY